MDGAEARRLDLLRKLEAALGKQEAETLMGHLPPVDWSRLVTTDYLDTRLDALRTELRSEMSQLRSELRSETSALRAELHSEISQVRLDMARWGRTQVYATIGAVVATGGLAFAAAGLT